MFLITSCNSNIIFEKDAGSISIAIDKNGKLVSLKDTEKNVDYIAKDTSYLMICSKYGTNDKLEVPNSAICTDGKLIHLTYPNNIKLTVSIEPKENYFRMELVKAEPVSEVSMIKWGPFNTNAQGIIGSWLGIVRSDDFSIGALSLEPNTDGANHLSSIAKYTEEGASIQLMSCDHTRGVFRDCNRGGLENELRHSRPIDVTVEGSSIALYGSKQGYDNELDLIEQIELKEGLPHLTYGGVWNKRSREQCRSCVWGYFDENHFKNYLEIADKMNVGNLCLHHGFSKNWGHFDIDEKQYTNGFQGILEMSKDAQSMGIGTALYSLTTFTKSRPEREPYLAPIPDNRLQTWRYESEVIKDVKSGDK